jgi:anaerobic selenocysteine-containing dehydrogenase
MTEHTVTGFCRICPTGCGVLVTVTDGVATALRGDPHHPLSQGYICPKGRKMISLVADPDVLDRPLMRNQDGDLVPASWDSAIDDLGERLQQIRERHGSYAIGGFQGTAGAADSAGRFALGSLMRALGSPSTYTSVTVDSIAKVLVPKLMAGREWLVPAVDFDQTRLLLVIGENLAVSHGGFSYFPNPVTNLRRVTQQGEVWVLDSVHTVTAHHATPHLRPRSSTDFATLA